MANVEVFHAVFIAAQMVHIGNLIKEELRRQGRSVGWFAKELYCDRTNVYDIFKRQSLDTALLFRISQLLQHDFFRYYTAQIAPQASSAAQSE